MTTAHDPTVGTDGMLYGQMIMIHSQKSWIIPHIWPQEPPTAPKALTTAPHAWSKLSLRSTVALMLRAAVAAWYGYVATPRKQIASKATRLSCVAAHVTHAETGEKELHGSAAAGCWQAERGGQRSAMLIRLADRVLVLT